MAAAPIYFLPDLSLPQILVAGRLSREVLESRGLDEVFVAGDVDSDRDVSCFDLSRNGPGGRSGVLLCAIPIDGLPPKRLGYYPDEQTWEPLDPPGAWLGHDPRSLPTPDDLRRRTLHDGFDLQLGGQTWIIPTVRQPFDGDTALPQRYTRRSGKWLGEIEERYRGIWQWSAEIHSQMKERGADFDLDEVLSYCVAVLGLNYRVGYAEQAILGLLTTTTFGEICLASFGIDPREAAKKNGAAKTPDTESSSPGSTAATEPTAPAEPTSTVRPKRSAEKKSPHDTTDGKRP